MKKKVQSIVFILFFFCSAFLMLTVHATTAQAKLKKPVIKSVTFEDVGDFRVISNKNNDAEGYELRYARSSSFSNANKISVKGKTLKKTVSGLSKGKTYYIKIRAYKKVDGKKSYSAYSDVVSYKTKKSYTAYVSKLTVTVYKEANSGSAKEKLNYMDKVTMYENVKSSSSGVWKKLKANGNTRYVWLADGDTKFTKKKNPYNYDAYVKTQFQEEVVAECLAIFKKGNTEYAHDQSDGNLNENGKYGYDCSGLAAYVTNLVMQQYAPVYRLSSNIEAIGTPTIMLNPGYESEWATCQVCDSNLDLNKLQPGDLVFFNEENGTIHEFPWNHCGIYLGNGDFIHSSSFYNGVKITPLIGIYKSSFQMAIRVLPESVKPIDEVRTVTEVLSIYPNMKCHSEDRIAKIAKGETVSLLWSNEKHGYVCYEPGQYGFVLNPEDKLKK